MCGICGIADYSGTAPIDRRGLETMTDVIAHRGPDDAGVYLDPHDPVALGFRRLSIIDLSSAGHQPMSNEDGSVWIVFNGEVYNYVALRRELESLGHRFSSRTDTETVIHGYEQWGAGVLPRLRGMFALAIWDRRSPRLVLARDRLGIKPLFYHQRGARLVFGSEIKAVLAAPDVPRTIDRRALYDYLTYNYVPCPATAYAGIRKLPPASYLVADRDRVSIDRYWTLDLTSARACEPDAAIESVRASLDAAVRSHLVSDVPVGVFLSGGLDSSTVAALMSRGQQDPVHTFSVGFDVAEMNELPFARRVADRIHAHHAERVLGPPDLRAALQRIVEVYDEPFADSSAIPTLAVSALAAPHVKVALSGEGGDEVFGGYRSYTDWLAQQRVHRAVPAMCRPLTARIADAWPLGRGWRYAQALSDARHEPFEQFARMMEWISLEDKQRIMAPEWRREFADHDDRWYLRQFWREDAEPLTRLQIVDLHTYLPDDLLAKVDRASMAVSLEVRVPLLDPPLVDALFQLPADLKIRNGETKFLERRAMAGELPDETLRRSKMGFTPPLAWWLVDEHVAWARRWLSEGVAVDMGLLAPDAVDRLSRKPEWLWVSKVWVLLVLETWLRREAGVSQIGAMEAATQPAGR